MWCKVIVSKRVPDYLRGLCRYTEWQYQASGSSKDYAVANQRVVERCVCTWRRKLVPPWAAGVVHDLSLNNPLPLIVPPGTVAVMSAIALPIITDFAFVLYLSNAVLSSCSDAVRYLDQFKDVLLEEHSRSAVCRNSGWRARGIDLHISDIASRRRTARSPHSHNRAHRWLL